MLTDYYYHYYYIYIHILKLEKNCSSYNVNSCT
jgi:hypothetical protein